MNDHLILLLFLLAAQAHAHPKAESSSSLRAMAIIFRHGDRLPFTTYPNDPHEGIIGSLMGNLTTNGCLRLYTNGLWLTKKWPELQNATRFFFSDSTSRCLESAKCLQLALSGSEHGSRSVITNEKIETMLNSQELFHSCPNYALSMERSVPSHRLFHEYSDLFDKLSQAMTTEFTPEQSCYVSITLMDSILVEDSLDLPMPSWFTQNFKRRLLEFVQKSRQVFTRIPIIEKLSVLLLQDVKEKLSQAPKHRVSLYGYSTHDAVLGPVLATLNVSQKLYPQYGESLIVTLDNDERLRFQYLDIHHRLEVLRPTACKRGHCTLDMLSATLAKMTSFDLNKDCYP